MRTKPKGPHRLNARLKALLAVLPDCGWNIPQAALRVGYSESYAQTRLPGLLEQNVEFCQELEKRQAKLADKVDYTAVKWFHESTELFQDCKTAKDRSAGCQVLKMRGQYAGAFEKDNQQRREDIAIVLR